MRSMVAASFPNALRRPLPEMRLSHLARGCDRQYFAQNGYDAIHRDFHNIVDDKHR
ncbi:hypothetical protein [Methylocystis bryophila]|uniref:hypothetical protein n=1 Tax=Methylocystis bryophila TaxID=655015 RepID=UPI001319C8A0|nr:hypothetical protein [Methylocystis bryophila]